MEDKSINILSFALKFGKYTFYMLYFMETRINIDDLVIIMQILTFYDAYILQKISNKNAEI